MTIRSADGSECVVLARWVFNAAGYYRYDQGHRPDFPGEQDFNGLIVHPQQWPDDLNYTDKKVVVIGSGATAVTLVPAMAERAAHVPCAVRDVTQLKYCNFTVADKMFKFIHLRQSISHKHNFQK